MQKKYKILKWSLLSILSLGVILFSFGYWFMSLIPDRNKEVETTMAHELAYLTEDQVPMRGKILAVVTSMNTMGNSEKSTGYELTELSRVYYVFKANGFEVDIASPLGGKPTVVLDDEDMGAYDYAFLNDSIAQYKANHTLALKDVNADDYEAIYFAGGKGAMFDFPDNQIIQDIVKDYYQSNKVVGAVCHGPAALVNVILDNGRPLIENKKVSGFTNAEELLLIPEAKSIFPFLLQDKMIAQGANYREGDMYLKKVSVDHNLVTGQNPWSTWSLAENMVKQLGYEPKHRAKTDEENAITVLSIYKSKGKKQAKQAIKTMSENENLPIKRELIAMHSIVAAMNGDIGDFFNLISLVSSAKEFQKG